MLKVLLITIGLELVLSFSASDALAIQNIVIYDGNIYSNNTILNCYLYLELFLLALLIIAGLFLYKKIARKNLNSQSSVKELKNRMEILETIVVNSDD